MLDLLPQMLGCMALGFAIPLVVTPVLRLMGLSRVDAASMAAHYGSVSVVTFAVASAYLAAQGVAAESHAALWVALMEAPGIVAGILLARLGAPAQPGDAASACQLARAGARRLPGQIGAAACRWPAHRSGHG